MTYLSATTGITRTWRDAWICTGSASLCHTLAIELGSGLVHWQARSHINRSSDRSYTWGKPRTKIISLGQFIPDQVNLFREEVWPKTPFDPAPGAWFLTKFISLAQVVPGQEYRYSAEFWPKIPFIHCTSPPFTTSTGYLLHTLVRLL